MSSPPKIFVKSYVLFITTSVEEGVLLPANPLMNLVILACLARAQTLHPIRLSDIVVEGTHLHMIVIVENPDDVKGFMERFKTESAHYINRLLGRRKRTVWCEGYDSPVLVTIEDVVSKLIYLYSNPVKDRLVSKIDEYPGITSWEGFANEASLLLTVPALTRSHIQKLPEGRLSKVFFAEAADSLSRDVENRQSLRISSMAWAEAFGLTGEETRRVKVSVSSGLLEIEREQAVLAMAENRIPRGSDSLSAANFDLSYRSERVGRRMWCHCHDKELRKAFIRKWKAVYALARKVFQLWKRGDFSEPFPPGLFPPSMPKLASALPSF